MRGATLCSFAFFSHHPIFQSTLPMRGATGDASPDRQSEAISIHAPHAGSDSTPVPSLSIDRNFNPRSPCGERPYCGVQYAEGYMAFQSTLPMRGATTQRRQACCKPVQFQSTLPMRGATVLNPFCWHWPLFQSTLPMRGATYILRI